MIFSVISLRCLINENITYYPKKHWTKHRHACTHFDGCSILFKNIDIKCDISEIFDNFMEINRCRHPREGRGG